MGTAVAKRSVRQVGEILEKARGGMTGALPAHITAERLIRVAQTACSRNPLLLQCTDSSLIMALVEASQLGLELGGVLGHAYLVPFKNGRTQQYEAQFIPGYRGIVDLVLRAGVVRTIEARVVREGDDFRYEYGLSPVLMHAPQGSEAPVTHVYAIARFKDSGEAKFEVMTRDEVEKVRQSSKARDRGPWVEWWEEMAKKTVVKRLSKLLPMSPEAALVVERDNDWETGKVRPLAAYDPDFGEAPEPEDMEVDEPEPSRTDEVRERVRQRAQGKGGDDAPEPLTDDLIEKARGLVDKCDQAKCSVDVDFATDLELEIGMGDTAAVKTKIAEMQKRLAKASAA